jgi:hypothetical protein
MNALPGSVRAAIWVLVVYALFVIAFATISQWLAGWVDLRDYPRGVVRAAGVLLITFGLARRARWAWWTIVILSGLWIAVGAVGVVALVVIRSGDATTELPPLPFLAATAFSLTLLAAAFVLLLLPRSRAAFAATVRA